MERLVIRHSLSEANNRHNYGKPAFGHADSPLMPEGRVIAHELGRRLKNDFGIVPESTPAAVSTMKRSKETALEAGFKILTPYDVLDEVDTKLPYPDLKAALKRREHSAVAIQAAENILANPPAEEVWVSHGLVIAGLCEVLGVTNNFENFVPKFCEIRQLAI